MEMFKVRTKNIPIVGPQLKIVFFLIFWKIFDINQVIKVPLIFKLRQLAKGDL